MKTRWPSSARSAGTAPWSIAFIRMRSPSSAPPLLRRDGSIEITAMLQRVVLVEPEAADQLVGQRALAGAAGAGDAEHRRLAPRRASAQLLPAAPASALAVLERGDQLRQRAPARVAVAAAIASSEVGACADRSTSQRITISPIIPASPMRWPSSGLKMRATP